MTASVHVDNRSHRSGGGERRGVLLLVVLVCIIIAGTSMIGVTRNSLRFATKSVEAERELQQRWGGISVQRTLLRGAPLVFHRLSEQARLAGQASPYPNSMRSSVLLGGVRFDALLADENAKLNLNLVFHRKGKSYTRRVIGQMTNRILFSSRLMPEVQSASLRPAPLVDDEAGDGKADDGESSLPEAPLPPAFRHWGQVFELTRWQGLPDEDGLLAAATTRISCWGRGRVNIDRAPDAVVEQVGSLVLSQGVAQRLVREYRENPMLSIVQVAQQIELEEQEALQLRELIGTTSSDYSLWLTVTSSGRKQTLLAVSSTAEDGTVRTDRFQY